MKMEKIRNGVDSKISKRGLVLFYENLIKQGKLKENSSGYKRYLQVRDSFYESKVLKSSYYRKKKAKLDAIKE